MILSTENLIKFLPEIKKLLPLHAKELKNYSIDLAIDEKGYKELYKSGMIKAYSMRREDGELIGYSTVIVMNSLQHIGVKMSYQDSLYILPNYRGRGYGSKFISFIDRCLKEEGVVISHSSVPSSHDWSNLLISQGYKKLETLYYKEL